MSKPSARMSETIFLCAGDANAQQELAVPVLVSNIIEIATRHANSLHIGNPDMADINGGWVLSRLTFEMDSYPLVNTSYRLTTWIESWNRRFSVRCFKVSSPDDSVVYGYARTVWMIMDTVTHQPLRLDHFQLPDELIDGEECSIATQAKHHHIEHHGDEAHYRFKYCDIDNYRHVNTVRYIQMLLNRFSLEHYDRNLLSRFELSFLHEAHYGMEVEIRRREREGYTSLALVPVAECGEEERPDQTLLFARISFRKR